MCILAALISLGITLIPERFRKPVTQGILWVVVLGTLRDQILLISVIQGRAALHYPEIPCLCPKWSIFDPAQSIIFVLAAGLSYYSSTRQKRTPVTRTPKRQKTTRIILFMGLGLLIALLPQILGLFYTEILDTTGLFIMMGLGLNIVVGFAGLLDPGLCRFLRHWGLYHGRLNLPRTGSL